MILEHNDKEFEIRKLPDGASLFIRDRAKHALSIQLTFIELAALRNHCTKLLDEQRRLKREREKRTGQLEVNLDR